MMQNALITTEIYSTENKENVLNLFKCRLYFELRIKDFIESDYSNGVGMT